MYRYFITVSESLDGYIFDSYCLYSSKQPITEDQKNDIIDNWRLDTSETNPKIVDCRLISETKWMTVVEFIPDITDF